MILSSVGFCHQNHIKQRSSENTKYGRVSGEPLLPVLDHCVLLAKFDYDRLDPAFSL
jgi:hypothetical protein